MVLLVRLRGASGTSESSSSDGDSMLETMKTIRKRRKFSFFRSNTRSPSNNSSNGETNMGIREDSQNSRANNEMADALKQTKIVASSSTPNMMMLNSKSQRQEEQDDEHNTVANPSAKFCVSSSILRESYLESLCGLDTTATTADRFLLDDEGSEEDKYWNLPDDPTVQESIECFLASHEPAFFRNEENGAGKDEESFVGPSNHRSHLLSPTSLQQTVFKNRSLSQLPPRFLLEARRQSPGRTEMMHAAEEPCFDAATLEAETRATAVTSPCACCSRITPIIPPEHWPQRPLLLRPTPNSGMRIKGVRFAGKKEYIWEASNSVMTWPAALHKHWGKPEPASTHATGTPDMMMCPQCMVLPINNGKEIEGESLVVDFESEIFEGTILLRVKDASGTTCDPHEKSVGYFEGLHRRYQVVVRGKFKQAIPWTECFAGVQLERPCGKLPSKWMIKGALNVISFFAPQLQARIDGKRPFSLTPLGSTPQSLTVRHRDDADRETVEHGADLEVSLEEPRNPALTLLGQASSAKSTMARARFRKKAFDKLYAARSKTPMTDPNKVYTFEFLQHLLEFDSFSIELGSMVGSIPLRSILDGQPLQIMASHGPPVPPNTSTICNRIWAFDLWHEMLVPDAERLENSLLSN